jgi:hypothetical protein
MYCEWISLFQKGSQFFQITKSILGDFQQNCFPLSRAYGPILFWPLLGHIKITIYIVGTVCKTFRVLFSLGTFDSFLVGPGRNQVYGACYILICPKGPECRLNYFRKAGNRL